MTPPTEPAEIPLKYPRPDLVEEGKKRLSFVELLSIRLIRASFEPGPVNAMLRFFQRTVGQWWILYFTRNLRQVAGLHRLPDLLGDGSVLIVANHRSFFDLYVITAELVRRKMKKRIVFPVRSKFFYDSPLGVFINFLMSFMAMYPPIFRDRKKLAMNLRALDELAFLLHRGATFAGLHPEGTRKTDDDPYTFLPAQPGVGRVVQKARVPVVPVFINGLGNDIAKQIRGNFNGEGEKVLVVFGEPIDFGDLLDQKPSPKLHRQIAERCMIAISELGQEEKLLRAQSMGHTSSS